MFAVIDAEIAALKEDPNRDIGPHLENLRQVHHKHVYSIKNPKEQNDPASVQMKDDTSGATSTSPTLGGSSTVLTSKRRRLKPNNTYLSNAIHQSMSMILGTKGSNAVQDGASLQRPIRCCRLSSLGKSDTSGLKPESLAEEKVCKAIIKRWSTMPQ